MPRLVLWITCILESRCSGRFPRYWRRWDHTLSVFRGSRIISTLPLGVVGLAIAQRLSERFPTKSTFLVERHGQAGEETRYVHIRYALVLIHNMGLVLETPK